MTQVRPNVFFFVAASLFVVALLLASGFELASAGFAVAGGFSLIAAALASRDRPVLNAPAQGSPTHAEPGDAADRCRT